MKQQYYFLVLLLVLIPVVKSYSQESIVASGGDATGSGGTSSYSIGQVVFTSQTGVNEIIVQGVQQPYEISTLGTDDFTAIQLVMGVYPNPTIDKLLLTIADNQWDNLSFQLFDVSGKMMSKYEKITDAETTVSMQELHQGIYFMAVMSGTKTVKTFKIIKN